MSLAVSHVASRHVDRHDARLFMQPLQPQSERISHSLELLQGSVAIRRRSIRAGDVIHQAGQHLVDLYVLHAGCAKVVNLSADGREQVAALHFRGDWLGVDALASGVYGTDAVAMDTGEVWAIRYDDLLRACMRHPQLLDMLHREVSRQLALQRDWLVSVRTLPVDARVAAFILYCVQALDRPGQRMDCLTLPMSRAEMGSFLAMTLETVSRALSRLARWGFIRFLDQGRRELEIRERDALADCVHRGLAAGGMTLQ